MIMATTTKWQNVWLRLVPALFTAGLLFMAVTASDPRVPEPVWMRWIPGVLGVGAAWFWCVTIARRITVIGAQLELERPIGRISIPIREIRRVNASAWNRGIVTVTANRRKRFLLRNT